KRGEDSRMRLNVLSELPQEWFSNFNTWKAINVEIRENKEIPDVNEEYFIYQTLVAGMPLRRKVIFSHVSVIFCRRYFGKQKFIPIGHSQMKYMKSLYLNL
ncbi:MAG: hypothetical protein R6U03_13485, partial [Gillisia sp.]